MTKSPVIPYLVAILGVIVLWYIVSSLIGNNLLPGPFPTFIRLGQEMGHVSFWRHIQSSVYRILAGLACAFFTAVPLGLLLGSSPRLDRLFAPLIYLIYPIPKIVFLPIILLFFGLGDAGKIILITIIIIIIV